MTCNPCHPDPLTILFQPPNGVGLGHISRLSAVALTLRKHIPAARLPFLIEGHSHELLTSLDLPYLTLPRNADWKGASWSAWPRTETGKIIRRLSDAIVQSLAPHAIVFDCFPIQPIVHVGSRRGIPMVLVIREMPDMEKYFALLRPIERLFSLFILPYEATEIQLSAGLAERARFVGTIVRPVRIPAMARGESAAKRIVICGGAGGFPGTVDYYNLAAESVRLYRQRVYPIPVEALLIAGPLFRDWHKLNLYEGMRVTPFVADMLRELIGADAILCQAGYNTIAEVSRLATPTICVPGKRLMDDQMKRAAKMAASNPNFRVFTGVSSEDLAALLETSVKARRATGAIPETNVSTPGAALAAELILNLINSVAAPG